VSVFVRIGLAWTHVSLRVSSSSRLPPARQPRSCRSCVPPPSRTGGVCAWCARACSRKWPTMVCSLDLSICLPARAHACVLLQQRSVHITREGSLGHDGVAADVLLRGAVQHLWRLAQVCRSFDVALDDATNGPQIDACQRLPLHAPLRCRLECRRRRRQAHGTASAWRLMHSETPLAVAARPLCAMFVW
jgi:hypothetical protein